METRGPAVNLDFNCFARHARAVWNRANRRIFSLSEFFVFKNRLVVSAWFHLCFFFTFARFSVEKNECGMLWQKKTQFRDNISRIVNRFELQYTNFLSVRIRSFPDRSVRFWSVYKVIYAFAIFAVIVFVLHVLYIAVRILYYWRSLYRPSHALVVHTSITRWQHRWW